MAAPSQRDVEATRLKTNTRPAHVVPIPFNVAVSVPWPLRDERLLI